MNKDGRSKWPFYRIGVYSLDTCKCFGQFLLAHVHKWVLNGQFSLCTLNSQSDLCEMISKIQIMSIATFLFNFKALMNILFIVKVKIPLRD